MSMVSDNVKTRNRSLQSNVGGEGFTFGEETFKESNSSILKAYLGNLTPCIFETMPKWRA